MKINIDVRMDWNNQISYFQVSLFRTLSSDSIGFQLVSSRDMILSRYVCWFNGKITHVDYLSRNPIWIVKWFVERISYVPSRFAHHDDDGVAHHKHWKIAQLHFKGVLIFTNTIVNFFPILHWTQIIIQSTKKTDKIWKETEKNEQMFGKSDHMSPLRSFVCPKSY